MRLPFPIISVKKNFQGFRFRYISVTFPLIALCFHVNPRLHTHQYSVCAWPALNVHMQESSEAAPPPAKLQKHRLWRHRSFNVESLFTFPLFTFYFFLVLYFLLYFFNLFSICVPSFWSIYTCKTQYQYKCDRISWR